MADPIDILQLRVNQQNQVIDQYRMEIFNMQLRFELLVKMLEERSILVKDEYTNRWPIFMKNDVGVIGPDGVMEGTLKVHLYGM